MCLSEVRTDTRALHGVQPATALPAGYGPADLRGAYALPSSTAGSGRVVGLVEAYDDPTAESDLATYRAQYGIAPCTSGTGCFRKLNATGGTNSYPPADPGWALEISLDLDMVSMACPLCRIVMVEANDDAIASLGAAENTAVRAGAGYISNSWGIYEDSVQTTAWDPEYFDHPGVAITASAGDSGYGLWYPAASSYVTSVGGTTLTRSATARGWTEQAWWATGSGCSVFEPKPVWQHDSGCSRRTSTDISAVADSTTGVAAYDSTPDPALPSTGWQVLGGTSVGSPIIAAAYALAGTPGADPAEYPYQHADALNDVTSGNNGACSPLYLCNAVLGYDGPTGLGTLWGVTALTADAALRDGSILSAVVGRCVDDDRALTVNGTKIQNWPCNGSIAQLWTVAHNGGLEALGKCADVRGSGTANGTDVRLWDCNGSAAQKWVTGPAESLVNPHSGKCLSDLHPSAEGTQQVINSCTQTAGQHWKLP